jgi:hypothetical protein
MYLPLRQGYRETRRHGDEPTSVGSPCLPLSLSPCVRYLWIWAVLVVAGCPRTASPPTPTVTPRASVALRVLVVNEPGVAEAINRLRGEWAERSGGELAATSKTWKEVAEAKTLDADAIIFPSRYLGELCVRGWLRPVRSGVLESDEFNAADVFPLIRHQLIKWGGEVTALPLAIDLVLPGKQFVDHPALAMLAEAAPNAFSNEREGVLFDPQTLKPRITDTAFVEALQRISDAQRKKLTVGTDFARYVPVFGFDDRLVSVTSTSRNGASAFTLIAWLSSAEISTQLEQAGRRLMAARKSLVSSPAWYDPSLNADERSRFGKVLEDALNQDKCLVIPRIPSVDEYLSALDDALTAAATENISPQAALEKAAKRWEQITDAHGRENQRQAYLKHLGIE